jgi:neuropilin and tolloid-like protein
VVDCVIAAEPGHLLRLDFRDDFYIEPSEECRYDYLEVRDGAHGYSTLIGTYCGNQFPPMLTSSDRYIYASNSIISVRRTHQPP